MKKQVYISRAFSILVLGLVLSINIFGRQIARSQPVKETKTEKKAKQPTQATVSDFSLEVLVPSHAFDFNEVDFIFQTPQIPIYSVEKVFQLVTKPIFRLSFFEKLFELHIAINAP